MDRLILGYTLIKFIRILDRAVFYTSGAARAFVLNNISGLFYQVYPEVTCLTFYALNLCKCQNLYVWMPADLDQFG